MIEKYATDLAAQIGIQLTKVNVIEGSTVGCLDVHLLHLYSGSQMVSVLIYKSELSALQNDLPCEKLELRIRSALTAF